MSGSGYEEFESAVLELLKGMRIIFMQMADLLASFSSLVEGPLKLHAALASNRLQLLSKNLEAGLRHVGANMLMVQSIEDIEKFHGAYVVETLKQLLDSLRNIREAVRSGENLDLRHELEKFENALDLAVNAFSTINSMISNSRREDIRILRFVISDLIEDLKLIRRRNEEAKHSIV